MKSFKLYHISAYVFVWILKGREKLKTIIPLQFLVAQMNDNKYMRKLETMNSSERDKKLRKLYSKYYKMYVTHFAITFMVIAFVVCVAFILSLFNKVMNENSVFNVVMLLIYTFLFTYIGIFIVSLRISQKITNKMIEDFHSTKKELYIKHDKIIVNGRTLLIKCKLNEIRYILRNEDNLIILFNKTNISVFMEKKWKNYILLFYHL